VQSTIDIDDSLVREAMALAQIRDPQELIRLALMELIERRHQEGLFGLVGKVRFRNDFDHKADRALVSVQPPLIRAMAFCSEHGARRVGEEPPGRRNPPSELMPPTAADG